MIQPGVSGIGDEDTASIDFNLYMISVNAAPIVSVHTFVAVIQQWVATSRQRNGQLCREQWYRDTIQHGSTSHMLSPALSLASAYSSHGPSANDRSCCLNSGSAAGSSPRVPCFGVVSYYFLGRTSVDHRMSDRGSRQNPLQ